MNKLQARYVGDVIAMVVLALFAAIAVVLALLAVASWLSGCSGSPFETKLDGLDYFPDAHVEATPSIKDSGATDTIFSDGVAEAEASSQDAADAVFADVAAADAADAGKPDDACQPTPSQKADAPPECGMTVGSTIPAHYARVQDLVMENPGCSWPSTPSACSGCNYTCECLLSQQLPTKSCSCRELNGMVPVVTCQ